MAYRCRCTQIPNANISILLSILFDSLNDRNASKFNLFAVEMCVFLFSICLPFSSRFHFVSFDGDLMNILHWYSNAFCTLSLLAILHLIQKPEHNKRLLCLYYCLKSPQLFQWYSVIHPMQWVVIYKNVLSLARMKRGKRLLIILMSLELDAVSRRFHRPITKAK